MQFPGLIELSSPAPILNTPEFHLAFGGNTGYEIPRDRFGHPLYYEFVALPGMQFAIEEILPRHHHSIYRIHSPLYPAPALFLDSRFCKPTSPSLITPSFPSRDQLADRMKRLLGTNYVWGGNWSKGIPELLSLYPPQGAISESLKTLWTLKGVDCSGLLYETTQGLSPRNSSALIHFGHPVSIEGKSPRELATQLLPMDMVVWPGHLWFVLDSRTSIESKAPFGVICRPLLERLTEVYSERCGVNAWSTTLDPNTHFVVRRFAK